MQRLRWVGVAACWARYAPSSERRGTVVGREACNVAARLGLTEPRLVRNAIAGCRSVAMDRWDGVVLDADIPYSFSPLI